jgi:SpoVK/Ycf46/Vps4 family AAA+-type ATPase
MNELGIPYVNSAMLTGDSGTGKTTFVQFLSKKFDMPMFYINFSWLIDSKLGKSSQNIREVFHFAREHKCILMLDEIDCIARERNKGDSCEHEFSNMTITILQELDQLRSNVILIAATNVPNLIDKAVLRRFSIIHEVTKPTITEIKEMADKYQKSINMQLYSESALEDFAKKNEGQPQSRIINSIIDKVVQKLSEEELL